MKILLLMPLDQQHSDAAMAIYKALSPHAKDVTFAMPSYMEYLVQTKLTPNFSYAFFDTLLAAQKLYTASKKEDLIIIGNTSKNFAFDKIFNFQDIEESLPYQDDFMEKLKTVVKEEPKLLELVNNNHTADESTLALHNCIATADFLSSYLNTSIDKTRIKNKYDQQIKNAEEN